MIPGAAPSPPESFPATHYLNATHGIKSWLLTLDHKRIGILYLIGVSFYFLLGGLFALLLRIELLTPAGDLVQPDTYNRLFSNHGVMMVFFFLIPAIPGVLGNFLLPLMIGTRDVAFPRLNLLSWYLFMGGAALAMVGILGGGVDTGWTSIRPTARSTRTRRCSSPASGSSSTASRRSSPASTSWSPSTACGRRG
jgi:cytochrome c oxidase subunit 1